MNTPQLIPTAEAAFIAGLSDRQMHRVVDERLVPEALVEQSGSNRLYTRLGAAFAKFYFATEDQLLAGARRQILDELSGRVGLLAEKDQVLALKLLDTVNWQVERNHVTVDVLPFLQDAARRANEVDQAKTLVTSDTEVMGGVPVFAGTLVPVSSVLSSLATGIASDRLMASYPFLTEALIHAAKVYEAVHPRRGRPRRLADLNPGLTVQVKRVVKEGLHNTRCGVS